MHLRIAEVRKAQGMSQTELGKKVHMNQATISRIENGEIRLRVDELYKIAQALQVSVCQLWPAQNQIEEEPTHAS